VSPLPAQFSDRWGDRRGTPLYDDAVCWHLLLGGRAEVRALATEAQQRLGRFSALHMTPQRWLHMTVLRAGPAASITQEAMEVMLARAGEILAGIPPVTVTLGRILYHPEAISLGVSSAGALAPVLKAAQAATCEVTGTSGSGNSGEEWTPHLTLCYSTGEQPAAPVIAALGRALPPCAVTIDQLSLVVQNGLEQLWDWRVAGTARLQGPRE
jgi:2'-5' RNA ligase